MERKELRNIFVADIDNVVAVLDMTSRIIDTAGKRLGVDFLSQSIDLADKRIHMYTGIDFLAYTLGVDTKTEPFGVNDIVERKSFEYGGYTFFQLSDTDPDDGSTYYR